jgi:hypothetical protein
MPESVYLFVHYAIRDADTKYGNDVVVEIKNGSCLSREDIDKLLVKQVLASEFGDEDDYEIDENEPERVVWESSMERCAELDEAKKIPQKDFDVLKRYIPHETVEPENNTFVFR